MRLTRIIIKGLFGMFKHDIKLNLDARITLLHGENGSGKTTILNIIKIVFDGNLSDLSKYLFSELIFAFDNGTELKILKEYPDSTKQQLVDSSGKKMAKINYPNFTFSLHTNEESKDLKWSKCFDKVLLPLDNYISMAPLAVRSPNASSFPSTSGRFADSELVSLLIRQGLSMKGFRAGYNKEPDWLLDLRTSLSTHFIGINRLSAVVEDANNNEQIGCEAEPTIPVVRCADDLKRFIQNSLTEYAELSQKLDSLFPSKLLRCSNSEAESPSNLIRTLKELDKKRRNLVSVGILEQEENVDLSLLSQISARNVNVLTLYVKDAEKKLAVFDTLLSKITLFLAIINSRFRNKKACCNRSHGLEVTDCKEKDVPLNALSSGEQQEIILFFNILFRTTPDALVMIDEPEISLHASWQCCMLEDLAAVAQASRCDLLLATHSPLIVSDRVDISVELKGHSAGV